MLSEGCWAVIVILIAMSIEAHNAHNDTVGLDNSGHGIFLLPH